MNLKAALQNFAKGENFKGTGSLSVALVVTNIARSGLPLDPDKLLAKGGGQVSRLGSAHVQAILKKHGIIRFLSKEGGRTSRGTPRKMRAYVEFLNALSAPVDFDAIERYWIDQVQIYFAGKPFRFRVDSSVSIRAAVRDLLLQARDRQKEISGSRYEGTMLQHLVGAKLDLVLGAGKIIHHSASEADKADGRNGDFCFGDVAIHTTTNPGESLLHKCKQNLDNGLRPLIVTTTKQTAVADGLADQLGISSRIDVLDVEQFLAANLHERALFLSENRGPKTRELIERYNELINLHETNPALRIELGVK